MYALRLLALPAIRREAERRWRESNAPEGSSPELSPPLLERALPVFDGTIVRQTVVDAPPAVTYRAILETNLLDPATTRPADASAGTGG